MKARNWSIPVVNHTWLEDCFIQWRNLSVGLEKYVVFPPGLDFSDHLGERGIQREVILETLPDLTAEMALAQGKVTSVGEVSNHRNEENSSPMTLKRLNARKVNKAKDAASGSDTEDRVDVDAQSQSTDSQGKKEDYMQVDEPAAPRGAAQNPGPKRPRRSSGRAGVGSSQLQQPTSPLRRTHEDPSSTINRHRRADPETAKDEHVPSPTRKSARTKSAATGFLVKGTSKGLQSSPSKPHPMTPVRMGSVIMPPIGTGEVLGRSPPRLVKKASPAKPKSHGSPPEKISGEHTHPLSSLTIDITTDREEGPSRQTSRRSAANKATQRLREEVMPDVVNFEKELRRGNVRAAKHPESKRGKERTDAGSRTVGKGKKRASIHLVESAASSDDEHERKKRRLSGAKGKDRSANMCDDDERADWAEASPQGTAEITSNKGGTKGAKVKKESSGGNFRQAVSIPRDSILRLTGQSEKSVRVLTTQVSLNESDEKVRN
jgi:mediator of DNA damage checkpoint protein 1